MRLNQKTAISTSKVLLVPYSQHHVPAYHEWMKDPAIQEATASEPLSLPEEYAMQKTWRRDADKLTFIVCKPLASITNESVGTLIASEHDNPSTMIGDVNLFLSQSEDSDDEDGDATPTVIGEVELMIAEKANQGNGYGRATLLTFLRYIVEHETEIVDAYVSAQPYVSETSLKFLYLRVKIGYQNKRSLGLFTKTGFSKVTEEPNYFGEFELRLQPGDLRIERIDDLLERHGILGWTETDYQEGI